MFQHMFAAMNEMLSQLIEVYPESVGEEKQQYEEQLIMLKQVNDSLVEQWIEFEEKLSDFVEMQGTLDLSMESQQPSAAALMNAGAAMAAASESLIAASQPAVPPSSVETAKQPYNSELDMVVPNELAEIISKGQGYYKLFMFSHAASQFQMAVSNLPECNLARLFLAMTFMHLQNWSEAQRHFQLLVALTDYPKWRALGYNALGCIQAVYMNLEQAEQLFLQAYDACPSFKDPLNNLKCCKETPQQLSLFFGSTELCCL